MIFPHDYPMVLASEQWDVSFLWKKKRLRYLLDFYYDELLDKNFGEEVAIEDPYKRERLAMLSITPLRNSVVNAISSLARVKKRGIKDGQTI